MSDNQNYNIAPELWDFLTQGEAPQDLILEGWEPMSPKQAMYVIYVLQEAYHLLPDVWEHCVSCDKLFDCQNEYYIILEDGHYCENCADRFGVLCQRCSEGVRWEDAIEAEDGDWLYCPKCWKKLHEDA
jgi:hypothetical protein